MVFSSLSFLILFLPSVIVLYYVCPKKYRSLRNAWLFLASLIFYGCGEPRFFPVFLCGILWNYLFGLLIGKCRQNAGSSSGGGVCQMDPKSPDPHPDSSPGGGAGSISQSRCGKIFLILCLAGDLGLLALFKYANFFFANIRLLTGAAFSFPEILLPIGISFFTFQEISYIADVYRGSPAQKNPVFLGLYIAFFPQLIAGPILRYNDFAPQLLNRNESVACFTDGFYRFAAGLCKKVLIANQLGQMVDYLLDSGGLDTRCAPLLLLAVLGFGLQLYLDFSGYSDMAIGLGMMFGFRIPENFRRPYTACSAADFWRKWHISLSGWFRDYVYIPLGGSRKGKGKTIRNLMIVWFLTGLWHGACWPCVLWGLLWGIWLIFEKYLICLPNRSRPFRTVYRILTVIAAMALFSCLRLTDLSSLSSVWRGIFSPARWGAAAGQLPALKLWLHDMWIYLAAALIVSLAPVRQAEKPQTPVSADSRISPASPLNLRQLASSVLLLLGMLLSISFIAGSAYNPFLYFQF